MNCVGIDVSKGKSMIAVMRPFGEVVVSPFEVRHTASELSELARLLKNLDGGTNPFPFISIFIFCENSNPKCYCGVRIAVVRTF